MNSIIERILPALIVGASIILASMIISNSNNYEFIRINGTEGKYGFSILNNKNTGRSCLLTEGAIGNVNNWELMAKEYSAPRDLCSNGKK